LGITSFKYKNKIRYIRISKAKNKFVLLFVYDKTIYVFGHLSMNPKSNENAGRTDKN
jgi:hypothetical protein